MIASIIRVHLPKGHLFTPSNTNHFKLNKILFKSQIILNDQILKSTHFKNIFNLKMPLHIWMLHHCSNEFLHDFTICIQNGDEAWEISKNKTNVYMERKRGKGREKERERFRIVTFSLLYTPFYNLWNVKELYHSGLYLC